MTLESKQFRIKPIKRSNNCLLFGVFGIVYMCVFGMIVMMVDTECEYFTNRHLLSTFVKIQQLQSKFQMEGETEEKKDRTKLKVKLTKRQFISRALSNHIDSLQVDVLRDRLQLNGLSVNETISMHQSGADKDAKEKTVSVQQKQYHTCAVVGNSDILLNSKCGAEIDAHDFVLRSNMAPTHNFRRDVGNRTDLMAVHQTRFLDIARCIQNKQSSCYSSAKGQLLNLGKTNVWIVKHGGINPRSYEQIATFARSNAKDLTFSYPNLKYVRTTISSFWDFNIDFTSNGIFLFTIAVPLCKRISLYGFSDLKNETLSIYPYFSQTPLQEHNPNHVMKYELREIEKLNATRTLRLASLPCV